MIIRPKIDAYMQVRYLDRVQVVEHTADAIWLRFEDDQTVFPMQWSQYRYCQEKGWISIAESDTEEWTP